MVTTNELSDIFAMIRAVPLPSSEFSDEVVWTNSNDGGFSLRSALLSSNPFPNLLEWKELVWFKGHTGKHSMCAWMAICNALETRVLLSTRVHIPN